jgi:hypothetical protein
MDGLVYEPWLVESIVYVIYGWKQLEVIRDPCCQLCCVSGVESAVVCLVNVNWLYLAFSMATSEEAELIN